MESRLLGFDFCLVRQAIAAGEIFLNIFLLVIGFFFIANIDKN